MSKKKRNKKKRIKKRNQNRVLLVTLVSLLLIFVIVCISMIFESPEQRAEREARIEERNMQKEQRASESVENSSSEKEEIILSDSDRQALEEYFNETMQYDCEGYLAKWETYNSDYSVMNLTFIQSVKYMSDNEKQYLMDTIGGKYDGLRQSFYTIGDHMSISFFVEDGTEIGSSTWLTPNIYKLKD